MVLKFSKNDLDALFDVQRGPEPSNREVEEFLDNRSGSAPTDKELDDFFSGSGMSKEEYISSLKVGMEGNGGSLGQNIRGFDRFKAVVDEGVTQEKALVPIKPYEGDFLDLYDNFEVIHGGGEGSVIKARRKTDGKTVALKKYFRGGIKTADDWKNSEIAAGRETSFLERALRDRAENVPRILDFGTTGPLHEAVVAMEYVNGRTLDAVINSHGFIPDGVVRIAKEVAKPLKYAHKKLGGFVHRDIKPANIMVDDDGNVIVLDWSSVRDKGLTLKNTQLYSPNYTAPEVLEGRSVTPAADVYSLGKTLEHCLVGSLFEEREGEITRKDLKSRNVPDYMIDALMKATQSDHKKRYQSIDEFVNDFEGRTEVPVVNSIPHPNSGELSDFQKRTLREVARNEWIKIGKFFGGILVAGIVGASGFLLPLYPRKNPEAKYIENGTGFQIFTDEQRFDYKFKEDGNDFCLLEALGTERKIRLGDNNCDVSADSAWVGSKVDESFYNPGAKDHGLKKFYDIHEVPKKIENWKIRHLEGGILGEDGVYVTNTGFTVDLRKIGLGNYGGDFVYYGESKTSPSSCRLEGVGISMGGGIRSIVDDNCDNSYDRVDIYNQYDKITYKSGGRTQDAGLNKDYDSKMRHVGEKINAQGKIKSWRSIFGNKK